MKQPKLPTKFQIIFSIAKVNGGYYNDDPPAQRWQFPTDTWFRRRLNKVRDSSTEHGLVEGPDINSPGDPT